MGMTVGRELLRERSLWEIYKRSLGLLRPSAFNCSAIFIAFLALLCDVAYFPAYFSYRVNLVRSLAELGLGFGSTVLGFLIAGFTIFSTLSKPELFLRMHQTPYGASGLSYLQVNFFTFVEVFTVYIFFFAVCLLIKLFGGEHGLILSIVKYSEVHAAFGYFLSRSWLANTGYVFYGVLAFYSILALKSFIFNIYHAVITSVVWSFNPPPGS